jgi:hypothetical protein
MSFVRVARKTSGGLGKLFVAAGARALERSSVRNATTGRIDWIDFMKACYLLETI